MRGRLASRQASCAGMLHTLASWLVNYLRLADECQVRERLECRAVDDGSVRIRLFLEDDRSAARSPNLRPVVQSRDCNSGLGRRIAARGD